MQKFRGQIVIMQKFRGQIVIMQKFRGQIAIMQYFRAKKLQIWKIKGLKMQYIIFMHYLYNFDTCSCHITD